MITSVIWDLITKVAINQFSQLFKKMSLKSSSLWGEGSVLMSYIVQSFQMWFLLLFVLIPPPLYVESHMHIYSESMDININHLIYNVIALVVYTVELSNKFWLGHAKRLARWSNTSNN